MCAQGHRRPLLDDDLPLSQTLSPKKGLVAKLEFCRVAEMQRWVWLVVLGCLWGTTSVHAQSRSGRSHTKQMDIERSDDVCGALSSAECCAQMLEIALFRATGDHVPKAAKAPVRLSCNDPDQTIPENACRLIAMSRGIGAREAAELCAPATLSKRCAGDDTCRQCMSDLERLDWKSSARACYALTYVGRSDTRVVTLERGKSGRAGTR